jgi:hypothetical protein
MKYVIRVPEGVENEDRYIKAAQERIAFNAIRGNRKRWLAAHADGERLVEFLFQFGEFQNRPDITGGLFNSEYGELILNLRNQLDGRGSLSEKQTEIVRKCLAQRIKWAAERAEKRASADAASGWVGTVGERAKFDVTVLFVTFYEGAFGKVYIHGMKDDAGNVIIHKGSALLVDIIDGYPRQINKGERVSFSATVKEHGTREGVKQTIVTRPSRADFVE